MLGTSRYSTILPVGCVAADLVGVATSLVGVAASLVGVATLGLMDRVSVCGR